MLSRIGLGKRSKKLQEPSIIVSKVPATGVYKFQHSSVLLKPHLHFIESIYQTLSISREHYKKLYIPLIENIAFLAQNIPASENHHHAHLGGLLEHSLEVGMFAARKRQGVMIKGVAEDQMAIVSEAMSYAVISSALLHDIGKVASDVQIANITTNTLFLPLVDTAKVGQEFTFRFRKERSYTDHLKANLLLCMQLMPENGIRWLSKYHEIYQQWIRALAGEYSEAGDIGRVVAQADSISTERATIASSASGQSASTNPLSKLTPAETFIRILRSILETQSHLIPLNKPGSAAWVAGEYIYFVSKRVIDEVKKGAERVGPSVSLPSDNSSIMSALGDGGKLKLNEDGKAIHHVTVREEASNWETTMTFLVFPRAQLDPANKLPETECVLVDKGTGEILHGGGEQTKPTAQTAAPAEPGTHEAPAAGDQGIPAQHDDPVENIITGGGGGAGNSFFESYTAPDMSEPSGMENIPPQHHQPAPAPTPAARLSTQEEPEPTAAPRPRPAPPQNSLSPAVSKPLNRPPGKKSEMGAHFAQWLKNYLTLNVDKVNSPGSALHIAEPGLLLMITPAIFGQYLDDNNPIYKDVLAGDGDEKNTRRELIRKVQFSVETQLTYKAAFDGSKIIKAKVTGNRHSGTINAYVLDKKSTHLVFQNLNIPNSNTHLSILTPLA